jgi:hypothetical protein
MRPCGLLPLTLLRYRSVIVSGGLDCELGVARAPAERPHAPPQGLPFGGGLFGLETGRDFSDEILECCQFAAECRRNADEADDLQEAILARQ